MKLPKEAERKVQEILSLKKITKADVDTLNKDERNRFNELLTNKLNTLKGEAIEKLMIQIETVTDISTKNELWERHHAQITWAISSLMQETGRMPITTEITNKTQFGRRTVVQHLKQYKEHVLFQDQLDQFKFMVPKVLASIFKFAVQGDAASAKLFLQTVGDTVLTPVKTPHIENQTNYIQINGITLNPQLIQNLKPEQLKSIELILTEVPETKAKTQSSQTI